jgi:hypothetical protein
MIELFVGALIVASTTILALHSTGRKPRRQETYTPDNRVGAVSVDIADRNGPRLDPHYRRTLEQVLPGIGERLK